MRTIIPLLITLGLLALATPAFAVPTSTLVNNLVITGLKTTPATCLSIGPTGLVATSTCGGGSVSINGFTTSTFSIEAGSGATVTTSTPNRIIISATGSGSSTVVYQGYGITLTPSPITSTGTIAINTSTLNGLYYSASNPSGFISTSTGLTVNNFASTSIGQWNNNGLYAVSSSLGSAAWRPLTDFLASSTVVNTPSTTIPTVYVATNTGNWLGTWQGVNSSTFYLASNPSGFVTSTILNGFRGTNFDVRGTAGRISSTISNGSTTFDLANSGVSANSYTCTDLTVDAYGRITTAANGTCGGGGVSVSGTVSSNQVALFVNTSTIFGDAGFVYDPSGDVLTIDKSLTVGGASGGDLSFGVNGYIVDNGDGMHFQDGGYGIYFDGSDPIFIGTSTGGYVVLNGSTTLSSYPTCTMKTDENGLLYCGTDNTGAGGGATTTINGAEGPDFTFTAAGTGLAITTSTNEVIFTWTNPGYITTSTGLTVNNFATTSISQWANDAGYITGLRLDQVANPSVDKTFTLNNNHLQFLYTNATTSGSYTGAFEIEATGAPTGDLVHIHQNTGNPGALDLLHLEADDADVIPLRITYGFPTQVSADITGVISSTGAIFQNATGTFRNSAGALYITTSTGLTVSNFATTSISQWNNNSGYITTSTGLTVNNFATTSIAQWANNDLYIPSSTYWALTPGGELGGTWASPTLDDSVTVNGWTMGSFNFTNATGTNLNAGGLTFTNATGTGNLTINTFTASGLSSLAGLTFSNATGTGNLQSAGLTFANATGTGNLQIATLKATGATNLSSTVTIQGATNVRGDLTDISGNKYSTSTSGGINTDSISIAITAPSSTTDSAIAQHRFNHTATLTQVSCSDDTGTSTIGINRRSTSTPNTAGPVMIAALTCGSGGSTSTFNISTSTSDFLLNFNVSSTAGTPGTLRIHVLYTKS